MSDWRPHRAPKLVGPFAVQYMTSSTHSHEGAHRIAIAGREVLVAPDGRTTARNRSAVITRTLDTMSQLATVGNVPSLWMFVGALVLEGVTSIEVDGEPLIPDGGDRIASIRLDVHQGDAGIEVSLVDLGGTGGPR